MDIQGYSSENGLLLQTFCQDLVSNLHQIGTIIVENVHDPRQMNDLNVFMVSLTFHGIFDISWYL